jgi:hypothetical protein
MTSLLKHKNLTDELVLKCTLISTYAQISGDSGFNDNSVALEEFVREFYSVIRNCKLKNTNLLQHNYPAIDLITDDDDTEQIAVQVTNTVNVTKIKNTIDQWNKLGKSNYKLEIIGIVKANKPRKDKVVTVLSLSNLAQKACTFSCKQLETLLVILNNNISPQASFLTTDKRCVDNIIDYLDRGAINHLHGIEGDYVKMYDSLLSLRLYLLTGKDSSYPVTIKPLSQYATEIKEILKRIECEASGIIAICDSSRAMDKSLKLKPSDHQKIDTKKISIKNSIDELKQFYTK